MFQKGILDLINEGKSFDDAMAEYKAGLPNQYSPNSFDFSPMDEEKEEFDDYNKDKILGDLNSNDPQKITSLKNVFNRQPASEPKEESKAPETNTVPSVVEEKKEEPFKSNPQDVMNFALSEHKRLGMADKGVSPGLYLGLLDHETPNFDSSLVSPPDRYGKSAYNIGQVREQAFADAKLLDKSGALKNVKHEDLKNARNWQPATVASATYFNRILSKSKNVDEALGKYFRGFRTNAEWNQMADKGVDERGNRLSENQIAEMRQDGYDGPLAKAYVEDIKSRGQKFDNRLAQGNISYDQTVPAPSSPDIKTQIKADRVSGPLGRMLNRGPLGSFSGMGILDNLMLMSEFLRPVSESEIKQKEDIKAQAPVLAEQSKVPVDAPISIPTEQVEEPTSELTDYFKKSEDDQGKKLRDLMVLKSILQSSNAADIGKALSLIGQSVATSKYAPAGISVPKLEGMDTWTSLGKSGALMAETDELAQKYAMRDPASDRSRSAQKNYVNYLKRIYGEDAITPDVAKDIMALSADEIKEFRKDELGIAKIQKTQQSKRRDFIMKTRKELIGSGRAGDAYQSAITAGRAKNLLIESMKDPTGFKDLQATFARLKATQGDNSVIREMEMRMGANIGSTPERLKGDLVRALTGEMQTTKQRQDALNALNILAKENLNAFKDYYANYESQAEEEGVDMKDVVDLSKIQASLGISDYTPAQEAGIQRVMKDNNVSREVAIKALKNAGRL